VRSLYQNQIPKVETLLKMKKQTSHRKSSLSYRNPAPDVSSKRASVATIGNFTQGELACQVAPQIGDRVFISSIRAYGLLRYVGTIDGKIGTWAGVELEVTGTGKNDGSVKG
jgi:hypothetical protein